jgi:hypothetical protein
MAQEVTQLQLSVRKENFKDKYAAGEEAPDCLRQVGYRDRS